MRVLMIEDDAALCEAVSFALEQQGFEVDVCGEGDDGLRWMLEQVHELVLLDRMLPRMDGLTLLKKARAQGVKAPVLMITALGRMEELVEGLDGGADDYIVKPFATEELLARIRAMQRRPRSWEIDSSISFGDLKLEPLAKRLECGSKHCGLSKRECALLEALMRSGGKPLSRSQLLSHVWGPDAGVEEGNLENYIHFVRRRLRSVESGCSISTVRGVGYCLEEA